MKSISVLDCAFGNIKSVVRSIMYIGHEVNIITNGNQGVSEILIIPGVSHYATAMKKLNNMGLDVCIKNHHQNGGAIIGICIGMQLLFPSSDEAIGHKGLCLIDGSVKKMPPSQKGLTIHTGWKETTLLKSREIHSFYYVHQYYCEPEDYSCVSEEFLWDGQKICAGISKGRIRGFQFHPEKSGLIGLDIISKTIDSI